MYMKSLIKLSVSHQSLCLTREIDFEMLNLSFHVRLLSVSAFLKLLRMIRTSTAILGRQKIARFEIAVYDFVSEPKNLLLKVLDLLNVHSTRREILI